VSALSIPVKGMGIMRFQRPNMLLGAIVGLALLAGVVAALLVVRQPETVYAPNSPQATVASFLRYLEQGQMTKAYALTSGVSDRQSFFQQFAAWRSATHRATLLRAVSNRTTAAVTVGVTCTAGDLLGLDKQSYEASISLERRSSVWRITAWYGLP